MFRWRTLSRPTAWYVVCAICAQAAIFALFWTSAVLAQSVPPIKTLLLPSGVAYDAAGNLFIADSQKNQVFEVSLAGVTTVVAGTGVQGFAGDGGPSTLALLNGPSSVAVATDGTLYIADTGNQRIRAIVSGQIQTVAGTGIKGFSGEGADARLAKLNTPLALAIDEGGLLIADSGNHRLRLLADGILTTIAGTGVQGFSGDGSVATLAQMDTPAGVAVASDGRIFVADSHNHRIRVIATNGTITTFAGNDVRGFSGDGGAATGASLFLPRGVAVTPAGGVLFADSDNQRLRLVTAQGVITTVAGSGVQGNSAEGAVAGTASLDSPRGVAVSNFAAPVFADAHNHVVQEVALDADLYALPGNGSVSIAMTVPSSLTYGQGAIAATVSGSAPVVQGNIALFDSAVSVSSAALRNATAMLPADTLGAGKHMLSVFFSGDGLHAAATSPAAIVSISPATAIATAQTQTMTYGSVTPALTGIVSGILPCDAALVVVGFNVSAPDLSAVGTYPISASLSGVASRNYEVTLAAASGSLQIVQAAASVVVTTPQISYVGLPITMTASVASVTRGMPTGTLNFFDNGSLVGAGNIANGSATAIYLSPGSGSHSITAAYAGDHNFLAAVSMAMPITVSAMPDFVLSISGNGTQSVQGGATANYVLQVTSQPAPFSGAVSMSVSGLPVGAVARFSPVAVIPGNTSAAVNLSVQTVASAMLKTNTEVGFGALLMFGFPFFWRRRHDCRKLMSAFLLTVALFGLSASIGCGDRNFSASSHVAQSFPITISATSTNLAGAVVVHTASVILVVE